MMLINALIHVIKNHTVANTQFSFQDIQFLKMPSTDPLRYWN